MARPRSTSALKRDGQTRWCADSRAAHRLTLGTTWIGTVQGHKGVADGDPLTPADICAVKPQVCRPRRRLSKIVPSAFSPRGRARAAGAVSITAQEDARDGKVIHRPLVTARALLSAYFTHTMAGLDRALFGSFGLPDLEPRLLAVCRPCFIGGWCLRLCPVVCARSRAASGPTGHPRGVLCPSGVRPGLLRAVVKTPIRSDLIRNLGRQPCEVDSPFFSPFFSPCRRRPCTRLAAALLVPRSHARNRPPCRCCDGASRCPSPRRALLLSTSRRTGQRSQPRWMR